MAIEVSVAIIVAFVIVVFIMRRLGDEGSDDAQGLDPRTSRRSTDWQFKHPPNEGGLL